MMIDPSGNFALTLFIISPILITIAKYVVATIIAVTIAYVANELIPTQSKPKTDEKQPDEVPNAPDWDFNNPEKSPGEDWEWKGKDGLPTKDINGKYPGNWVNKKNGDSLHPDLNHEPPIGPHWDYNDEWRVFEDGTIKPKKPKVTIPKIPLFD